MPILANNWDIKNLKVQAKKKIIHFFFFLFLGAFPLSDQSLMTDEERKRYLPATKLFVKVLEKEFIDQNEINELIKRGEDLQDLMPERWNDGIIQTLNNHIGYDFDANGNIVNARRTQVYSGRVGN